jgi:hypothetical protein
VISAFGAELLLSYAFIDAASPFATDGFIASLHTDALATDIAEIYSASYSRILIPHGASTWAVGSRAVTNLVEFTFPLVADGDEWRSIRSLGLRSVNHDELFWPLSLDEGALTLTEEDQLLVPAGGLVYRLG